MQYTAEQKQALTVVVGLGTTGLACARFLRARGLPVAVTDSRAEPPQLNRARAELAEVPLALGGFDEELLGRADSVLLSPGVSPAEPALVAVAARGVPLLSEIELFARYARAPVVAITGSNGKSTVTTLLGEMALAAGIDCAVGGNLGTPALDLIRTPEPQLYILELSSFQLEATESLNACAAVMLNLSADHMDRYADLAAYAAAKQRVYRGDGVQVINLDDPACAAMAESGRRQLAFSLAKVPEQGFGIATAAGGEFIYEGEQPLMAVAELKLPGRHNLANALAALALGRAAGLPTEAMLSALRDYGGLPHRTQWVGAAHGVNWYDDSKGTNVGATLAALAGLPGPLVLIAGGEGKDADFEPLRAACAEKARAVVLIGRDAPLIEQVLQGAVPVRRAQDMEQAVRAAAELAQPGDKVLLSPACASFDMFSGYEERGRCFVEAVRRWVL